MAQITTREVSYPGKAGNLKAYLASPAGTHPVVIVVQEWWGLNENIKDIARRFANEGYFAIAPDLYSRQGHKVASDPNTAAELMGGLKTEDGIEDLKSTIAWLRAQNETKASKIGITGYCMGGSYAMRLPCESKDLAAAAPFYGEIPSDDTIKNLHCPIFYAYGANDGWIQRPDVERLAADLKQFGKSGAVKVYEGCDHGFFNDTRKDVFAPDAAKDAWQLTLKLFAENLKG
jgi:carboxymethylenebutenolidase